MTQEKITRRKIESDRRWPRIDMRMVKTMAVFICLELSILRGGRVIHFYSAIATILCMQSYVENSIRVALNRMNERHRHRRGLLWMPCVAGGTTFSSRCQRGVPFLSGLFLL